MDEVEAICPSCGIDDPAICDIDSDHCESCCECVRCPSCNHGIDNPCSNCRYCNECCDCITCSAGRSRHQVDAVCDSCLHCPDHCECYVCNGCGNRVDSICSDCDNCESCGCGCNRYSDPPRHRGRFNYLGTPTKTVPRFVSLELEYAGCDNADEVLHVCHEWEDYVVEDGSLPDEGFEINMNPSCGDTYGQHVDSLMRALSSNAKVNQSCGMHVHVDARDLNWHDLFKLTLLYSKVEPALFSLQPSSRQDNNYCLWVAKKYHHTPKDFKHGLLNHLYSNGVSTFPKTKKEPAPCFAVRNGKHILDIRTEKYHSARYYAMNVHTWFYRGTIEFRHAASTGSATKAKNWGLICMWLVEKASTMTYAQIAAMTDLPYATAALTSEETDWRKTRVLMATNNLQSILPTNLAEWVNIRQKDIREGR